MSLEGATYISDLIITNPPDGDPRSQGDDHLRLLKAVLLNTFPNCDAAVNLSVADFNLLAGMAATPTLIQPIPVGTQCLFYQAAAPTGWTQVTTVNDKLLRVVSGTGGGSGGGWAITGLTTGSHVLTTAEMPAHTHRTLYDGSPQNAKVEASGLSSPSTNSDRGGGSNVTSRATLTIEDTGGGQGHTHSISHDGSWRPAYVNVILCSKASV